MANANTARAQTSTTSPPQGNSPVTPSSSALLSQDFADEVADALGESLVNELYLFMFQRRSVRAEDVREAGFDPESIDSALAVLAARGLITAEENDYWAVLPPSRSFPPLAARLEERARLLRTALPGLSAAYNSALGEDGNLEAHGIEFLPTAQDVAFAMAQCYAQSATRVRTILRDSIASRQATFEALPSLREGRIGVAQRSIECTTVLHTALVRQMNSDDLDWLEDLPHEQLMLAGRVPATAVVSDVGTAVIESTADGTSEGLLITHPQLVQAISEVVDLVIEQSSPWNRVGERTKQADALSSSEQEILHMLALGIPDATIARRLRISSRTFDRRLRAIMDALGAATRFQAGVIATRRDWL